MVGRIFTLLFIGLLLFGCKSKKQVVPKKKRVKTEKVVIVDKKDPIETELPNKTDETKIDELPRNASYAEILSAISIPMVILLKKKCFSMEYQPV